jgi:Thiamine pyrophosphate enzyme, C-terminal TPP binding domain
MRIQTAENQTAGLTVPRRNPPPDRDTARSWPEQIFQKLREAAIRQVTYVPDAGHARLIELCHAEPVMKTTVLTTEEGIGVLSGAWLGGKRGVRLMQSSGVDNCINTLSLARVCGLIVTMRGDWGEVDPWQVPMGQITVYLWGAMGSAVTVGLGLALAQPKRRVLVVTGDGEMLMGLGALATVAVKKPDNLAIVVIDNEHYGETGMQRTHTAAGVDLAGIARVAGFRTTATISDPAECDAAAMMLRSAASPVMVVFKVSAASDPLVLPSWDGPLLKNRFRQALLDTHPAA